MAVRHGEQDRLGEQRAEELNLLLVAGRAEPAPLAGEGQQVFVLAVVATDTGKPLFKGAAVEELAHHLRDDGPQKPVSWLKTRLVAGAKGVEVPFQALPEGGDMGLARSVELHATWVYATRALNLTPAPLLFLKKRKVAPKAKLSQPL